MMVYIEVPKVVLYGFIFIFLRINPKFSECVYILDLFITQLEIDFLYVKFKPLCIQISKHKVRHKYVLKYTHPFGLFVNTFPCQ